MIRSFVSCFSSAVTQSRHARIRKRARAASVCYEVLEPRKVLSAAFPAWANGQFTLGNENNNAPYGLTNTFKLQSLPNSTKTIYLDFNGHHSVNNSWNHNINFQPFNINGNPGTFSAAELIQIQKIFQNVAEDFLPLNVNVTTRNPPVSDLVKSSASDNRFGVRVVMTQAVPGFADNAGGTAKINSFTDRRDTPAFGFAKGASGAAFIASHEVGHTLGLTHDGTSSVEYYHGGGTGETSWAPIMANGYGRSLVQWNKGEYPGATNQQDDLALITRPGNGISHRVDDRGNGFSSAKSVNVNGNNFSDWGIISSRQDKDFFKFEATGTRVTLDVKPFEGSSNLDLIARLYDRHGNLVATSNPTNKTSANISRVLASGTYYLSVDGIGKSGAYTDYGSLGFFTIDGTVAREVANVGESGIVNNLNGQWRTVQLARNYADPVVVAGPASNEGSDQATVRIRNVTNRSFQIKIDEWDYLDDNHAAERVGYVVMESGEHRLADGTKIVARNSYVNHEFRKIGFGTHFDSTPVVFSQTTSTKGIAAVTTRMKAVNTGSFDVKLQEEEAANGIHSYESVGWIAIERGTSETGGLELEVDRTARDVDEKNHRIALKGTYSSTPVLLAGLQSYYGKDTASLRLNGLSRTNAYVFVSEERSKDDEVDHTDEVVGYFAIQRGFIKAVVDTQSTNGPVIRQNSISGPQLTANQEPRASLRVSDDSEVLQPAISFHNFDAEFEQTTSNIVDDYFASAFADVAESHSLRWF